MRAASGTRGGWRGQSAVEFALSSLLLLTMIFGTIDLGRVVFLRTMVTNAVRELHRALSIPITPCPARRSHQSPRSVPVPMARSHVGSTNGSGCTAFQAPSGAAAAGGVYTGEYARVGTSIPSPIMAGWYGTFFLAQL